MDTHLRLTRLHHTVQKSSSAAESESLVQNCLRFRHRVEFFFFFCTSRKQVKRKVGARCRATTTPRRQRSGTVLHLRRNGRSKQNRGREKCATRRTAANYARTHTRRTNRKYNRLSYNLWRRTTAAETTTWGVTIGDVTTEHGTHINYGLATAIVDNERRLFL